LSTHIQVFEFRHRAAFIRCFTCGGVDAILEPNATPQAAMELAARHLQNPEFHGLLAPVPHHLRATPRGDLVFGLVESDGINIDAARSGGPRAVPT
jgi:hypothetical protein